MDPSTPSTPPRKRLTRDQRRDILLMRRLGYSYEYIASFLKVSQRAVQYTCQKQQATPQHYRTGRPPRLSKEEADRLEEFVTSCQRTRQLSYLQIAEELWPEGEVGADSVKYTLHKRGYRRRVALRKPPLSQKNKEDRFEWAQIHIHWTEEQWNQILWSDET
jgi:transposase